MKAISLWQPWASAIAVGAKRVETRSWATKYRGPPDALIRQIKRAIYHLLKSTLEFATVFAPVEQVLFPWIETAEGRTLYESAAPNLHMLNSAGGAGFQELLALPAPRSENHG